MYDIVFTASSDVNRTRCVAAVTSSAASVRVSRRRIAAVTATDADATRPAIISHVPTRDAGNVRIVSRVQAIEIGPSTVTMFLK